MSHLAPHFDGLHFKKNEVWAAAVRHRIAPIFEAIAITAAVKLKWPACDPAKSKIAKCNTLHLVVPIMEDDELQYIAQTTEQVDWDLFREIRFREEHIYLQRLWTGSHSIWLGYGEQSDILAFHEEIG